MHYYIDGYNLMFRIIHAGETLQSQREKIIEDLYTKIHVLDLSVSLVFDSQYQIGETTRSYKQHLEILFTALGQTADDLILDELKKSRTPQQNIVVTSDKKLAWLARRSGSKTENVEEFISWLNKRYQNKIRHQREKKTTEAKKEPVKPPNKIKVNPTSTTPIEDCSAYYLEIFEKNLEALEPPKILKSSSSKSVKKKKKNPPKKSYESDSDRWLRIFQEGNTEQDNK